MIIEASPEYLLNMLDEETARKVWKHLQGMRIYFPKCKSRNDEINTLYQGMKIPRSERIKRLSDLFEISQDQIRRITKKQGALFEEN